jgi:hypothetical protein
MNCRETALFIKPLPKYEIMVGIDRRSIIETGVAQELGKIRREAE